MFGLRVDVEIEHFAMKYLIASMLLDVHYRFRSNESLNKKKSTDLMANGRGRKREREKTKIGKIHWKFASDDN